MDKQDVDYAKWCIENDIHKFYIWPKWIKTREEVLMLDRYECQDLSLIHILIGTEQQIKYEIDRRQFEEMKKEAEVK